MKSFNSLEKQENDNFRLLAVPQGSLVCTRPLYLYLKDVTDAFNLFMFSVRLVGMADQGAVRASKALIIGAKSDEEKRRYENTIANPDRNLKEFSKFSALNSKNMCSSYVDGFVWYISEIIQSSMKRRPELVKSKTMISAEDIFEFKSKKEIVNFLIDKKINDLTYGGMSKIEAFVKESLGVDIFSDEETRSTMQFFIEVRNINTHNRGIANRRFMSRAKVPPGISVTEGRRVFLDYDNLIKLANTAVKVSTSLDSTIAKKFKIERKRLSTWAQRKNSLA